MDENRVIGVDNQLPWRLPKDLKRFKEITQGHTIIMGRKTFDSIGKPLPNRRNIILSRQKDLKVIGCEVYETLDQALVHTKGEKEVFVIGGDQIYKLAWPKLDRLYITQVHTKVARGDAYFPEVPPKDWKKTQQEDHAADEKHAFSYSFQIYERQA